MVILFSGFNRPSMHLSDQNKGDSIIPVFRAKDHQASNKISSNGFITLVTGLDNNYFMIDSLKRKGYFYIETSVGRFINDTAMRVPLNISIVIDRSGSMQGVKMGFAKRAAKSIIEQLQPNDMVSIVIYDNSVDSIQPPVAVIDKELIKSRINSISPRGSTNLWGGTEMGYDFVKRNYKEGYINRVLLISDGIANTGLTDSNIIRMHVRRFKDEEGITISTFGVGLDYNEDLMTEMAETGAGNYYYIDAPEKLTNLFQEELAGLLTVAARDAELKINFPEGVTIDKAYPLSYQINGTEMTVKLRDLFSEETKALLVSFNLPDQLRSGQDFITQVSYTDVRDGERKTIVNKNQLDPVHNKDTYYKWYNRSVIEQTILFSSIENLENAMLLVDRGDLQGASRLLARNENQLKLYSSYIKTSRELNRIDSINKNYTADLAGARHSADSLKKLQKASKAANYGLRQKKQ